MISLERVRQLLSYDPETGVLTWLEDRNERNPRKGIRAGTVRSDGYRSIIIERKWYAEHRLIWFHYHGYWPAHTIDHINCKPADNRIENLREATISQNLANRRGRRTFPKGVVLTNGAWVAHIRCAGRVFYLGRFKTAEEAGLAYSTKARELFGEFARVA